MRLSLPLLVPALACLAQADSGKLYIYDGHLQSTSAESNVSPETARLILASRLGLDEFHELGNVKQDTIEAINHLSADQHLFAASREASVAVLLGEGVNQKDILQNTASHHLQTLRIDNIPSVASTEKLISDLASQSGITPADKKTSLSSQLREEILASPAGSLFRIAKDEADFTRLLDSLLRQDYTVLALAVPNDTTSKYTYGEYDTSSKRAAVHKRQRYQEAPLITESPSVQEPDHKATLSPNAKSSNNSTPLKGILPMCFSSQSACEDMTRNCSGHGSCSLKYTNNDARPAAPCYSCSCSATVVTNKDGSKKTTKWGGPACQKKDVVMPFWLLAGFSVLMASLVSWGIGMLLTMGNEELPSVIGAGVSGVPRTR